MILLGLSKGGFAGAGALSLPVIAFAVNPVQAAAILLPILIVQDVVGVWAFRRHIDYFVFGWTLAGAVIGIIGGYLFAAMVSADIVLAMVGVISILFGAYRLWRDRHGPPAPSPSAGWIGGMFGIVSGFTSQIAHAGQPPWQLWVMPRGLSRDMLIGTSAVYFAAVNWIKVPAYLALGQFTRENLLTAAALMPVAILSTLAGVWLVRRVSPERFYTGIYWLMIGVGVVLVGKAVG